MSGLAKRAWEKLVGRGSAAVTVPPMDGALRPNSRLEQAAVVARIAAPDHLIRLGSRVVVSSGRALVEVDPPARVLRPLHEFGQEIACVAARGDGLLAVGMAGGDVFFGSGPDSPVSWRRSAQRVACPTAMTFDARGDLIVCQGSAHHPPDRWKHDLMERGSSGAVWRIGSDDSAVQCLARGLAFPFGVVPHGNGLAVSESWAHRIVHIDSDGSTAPLLGDLPGYPARIVPSRDGYWLCVFAPRSQLVEFVLRERRFRERMMREVDDTHWVAPTLSASRSYLDPMQGGGMVTQGQIKPWAPTRSYGLVVRLDAAMRPVDSFHSRADGRFHGVTSCVETEHGLLVASKGDGAILALRAGPSTGRGEEDRA
jgi:hypothetical protein